MEINLQLSLDGNMSMYMYNKVVLDMDGNGLI